MKRNLIPAACSAIVALVTCLPTAFAKQPNVVFILTDDQRWDALSCMGNPHPQTPNIDRLAAEGALFKNHFCTTSLCSPSRASILGGLYAHTHGVVNNFTDYPARMTSFPMRLQQEGYETAYIGKWHMGEADDSAARARASGPAGRRPTFSDILCANQYRVPSKCAGSENGASRF